MCAILYFYLIVCIKPHANLTIIYENIKEIHILAVGGTLEFPILSHVLLRRGKKRYKDTHIGSLKDFNLVLGTDCTGFSKLALSHQCMKQREPVKLKENVENAKPEPREHHQSRYFQSSLSLLATDC